MLAGHQLRQQRAELVITMMMLLGGSRVCEEGIMICSAQPLPNFAPSTSQHIRPSLTLIFLQCLAHCGGFTDVLNQLRVGQVNTLWVKEGIEEGWNG